MTAATGQTLRRTGLAIEALCMIGLLSVARGRTEFWARIGADPSVVLAAGIGVGFLIWATGTYAILRARRKPGPPY